MVCSKLVGLLLLLLIVQVLLLLLLLHGLANCSCCCCCCCCILVGHISCMLLMMLPCCCCCCCCICDGTICPWCVIDGVATRANCRNQICRANCKMIWYGQCMNQVCRAKRGGCWSSIASWLWRPVGSHGLHRYILKHTIKLQTNLQHITTTYNHQHMLGLVDKYNHH